MTHNRCNYAEHVPVGRRELLKVGGMSLIGAEMADEKYPRSLQASPKS